MRVRLRSRIGSIILGILGLTYAITATVLLILYVVDTWGAASLTDRALQVVLAGAVLVAAWFMTIAANSLGISLSRRRSVQPHRAGAATSS